MAIRAIYFMLVASAGWSLSQNVALLSCPIAFPVPFSSLFLLPTNFVASANAIGDMMVTERAPKTALKLLSESP